MDFRSIKLIIFDCDGVLVNSEEMSCHALNIVFMENHQIDIGTDYTNVLGTSVEFAINHYIKKFDIENSNIDHLIKAKERAYFDLAKENLTSFQHGREFLEQISQTNIRMVVASSGSFEKINFSLNQVNFGHYFEEIFSSSQVKHGKPAPDLFNFVRDEMNIESNCCLVIEDSINGVQAALNADLPVVAFPGSFPRSEFEKINVSFLKNGYSDLMDHFKGIL